MPFGALKLEKGDLAADGKSKKGSQGKALG